MATYFFDPVSGNNANDGLSFANRKQTISSITPAAGDLLKVIAAPDATSLGQSLTWTQYSPNITLSSALTKNVALCDVAFTASANVTATANATLYKVSTASANLAVAAGFTTGLVAYYPLGAVTDFSAYQQLSFWIQCGTSNSQYIQIKLCSDTVGAVAVNTITVPATIASTASWHPVTVDTGGALGASIQSVAVYLTSDPGAITIRLSNIIACKAPGDADSLTLNSLISPQSGMSDTWYPIQSINDTAVILGGDINYSAGSANLRGYSGATVTATTYKRQPLILPNATGGNTTTSSWAVVTASGTQASPITISGGWDRTDMSTQTGESFVSAIGMTNVCVSGVSRSWVNVEKIHPVHFYTSFYLGGCSNWNLTSLQILGTFGYGVYGTANATKLNATTCRIAGTANYGIIPGNNSTLTGMYIEGTATNNYNLDDSNNCILTDCYSVNGTTVGIDFAAGSNNVLNNLTSTNNGTGSLSSGTGLNYLNKCTLSESAEFVTGVSFSRGVVFSQNHDNTTNNHKQFMDGALIVSDTGADRHVASGMAWKLSPTSTNRSSIYPVELSLAKIACKANFLVTYSIWVKRSVAASITARVVCKGGQIAGVPADVVATASAGDDTYEQLTITFTPTEQGVVEITAQAYGGTTASAWFHDSTISQA